MGIELDPALPSTTRKVSTPDGTMYVIITEDEKQQKPVEIFISIGKAGSSIHAWANAFSTVLNLALRKGAHVKDIMEAISGNRGDKLVLQKQGLSITSGPEGVFYALSQYLLDKQRK